MLANAYFIGKIIFPEAFSDIDPMEKAEEISKFLNGGPAFTKLNEMFGYTGFKQWICNDFKTKQTEIQAYSFSGIPEIYLPKAVIPCDIDCQYAYLLLFLQYQ